MLNKKTVCHRKYAKIFIPLVPPRWSSDAFSVHCSLSQTGTRNSHVCLQTPAPLHVYSKAGEKILVKT